MFFHTVELLPQIFDLNMLLFTGMR